MAKTLRILLLGLAIVLSGTAMAQTKSADRNARLDKVMKLKNGRHKSVKKAKNASLFTKTTTLLSEDFQVTPDTAWHYYDNDADGYNWEYDSYEECMVSYSYDPNTWDELYPDNWLITPQVTIPSNGAILSYVVFPYSSSFYEEVYSVMVSPSGSYDLDSFYVTILSDDTLADSATTKNLLLNQYAGQTVRLAFVHHNCYDQWAMGLDDIEVYTPDSIDLAVTGSNVIGVSPASASTTFTATVENKGLATLNNITVYCDVNGTVTNTTIASLSSLQTATATFTGLNLSNSGTYNIKFYVAFTGDADNTNDTLHATTDVLPSISLTWDFEGDTNLPAGFTTGRYDNGTAYSTGFFPNNEAWVVFDDTEYDYLEPGFDGGVRVAMSESWFDENDSGYKSAYPANRWLITPSIRLTSGNYFVWDAYSMDDEYLEDYKVRISTTNTDTASFTTLATIYGEEGTWQRRSVNLSAYAGQDVYIAFQYISDDMFRLLIDNLKIAGPATLTPDGPEPPEGITNADGSDINVYPNPTTGVITVAASNITRIEVIDAMGRVAMTQEGSANTMNISALAEGVYTLRVATENGVSMKRIVKK